jgi:hypothetical protein
MDPCVACGVPMRPGTEWCPQCFVPVKAREPSQTHPAWSRSHAPGSVFLVSNRRPGPTSYGWVGRLVVSMLLIVFSWWAYYSLMPFFVLRLFGVYGVILYLVFAGPVIAYLLWRIWRAARID